MFTCVAVLQLRYVVNLSLSTLGGAHTLYSFTKIKLSVWQGFIFMLLMLMVAMNAFIWAVAFHVFVSHLLPLPQISSDTHACTLP